MYIPLHTHTTSGSINDSVLKVGEYVNRAKELGLPAIAITDHGSLGAMFVFDTACREEGIKPIIGLEAYEVQNSSLKDSGHRFYNHLVLLAKTDEGVRNLIKLHNDSQLEGYYYKPRVDRVSLKRYGRGLIGLSACVQGSIPKAILDDDLEGALEQIAFYKSCFDEFYLELQPGSFTEQEVVNDGIAFLAKYTNTPVVLTNDIHYLEADHFYQHDVHLRLGRKQEIPQGEHDILYPDKCYWFMNEEQIRDVTKITEWVTEEVIDEAIANTVKIAESCTGTIDRTPMMPHFMENHNEEGKALKELCKSRLQMLATYKEAIDQPLQPIKKYEERLEHELEVIGQLGYSGYFLVVWDYVNWAKDNGIAIGPGRGSVGGSLVAYVLGITVVDPIKYNLMFERFLDPERASSPDIDMDISDTDRDKLFDYIVNKYGYENCAQVATIGIRKAKSAIRAAARVLGVNPEIGDEIADLIPVAIYGDNGDKTVDVNIEDAVASSEALQELQERHKELFDLAKGLENLPSYQGVHAAGVLISPVPLYDRIPLIKNKREGLLATSLNMESLDGYLEKVDLLGLSTLSVIHKTETNSKWQFDYYNDNIYKDPEVWKLIGSKYLSGVFQCSSPTYKRRMWRLKPHSIPELANCLALLRGPCISQKLDEEYMQILEGKKPRVSIHPLYDDITYDTHGILIYQEQIMKLIVAMGLSMAEGYQAIKAISRKKIEIIAELKDKFIDGAIEKDINVPVAERFWEMIEAAGAYAFNRSHRTCGIPM